MINALRSFPKVPFIARSFAVVASPGGSGPVNPYTVGPFQVFDRQVKRKQKDRAAAFQDGRRSRTVDYLRDEIADRMIERFIVCYKCFLAENSYQCRISGHKAYF